MSKPVLPPVSPEVSAQDRAWENHLVQLLSELEIRRARLAELQALKRPGPALQAALSLVDRAVEFAEQRLAGPNREQLLLPILARAGSLYATAREAVKELSDSPWASLTNLFTRTAEDKANRRHILRTSTQGIKEVLTSCFELFQTGFQSPEHSHQWAQTYGVFLADLTRVLDQVDC